MIIVIRGTNGSGKSHTVRQILKTKEAIVAYYDEQSKLVRLPRVKRPVLVIGPYVAGRSMGGCDCIRQPSKIYRLIDQAIQERWHVLLEGVVLATKPYLKYHRENQDVRYAFLDTPLDQCLKNIDARQRKKGHASIVSRDGMRRKRHRAHDMFIAAKEAHMIAARFTNADEVIRWVGDQLRRP